MRNFDKWFAKSMVLLPLILITAPLFWALDSANTSNILVFVSLVIGCNITYDATKRVIFSSISNVEDWCKILREAWLGVLLTILSFVGVYIDALVFNYVGIGLIWFPLFIVGMNYIGKAERTFREAEGN